MEIFLIAAVIGIWWGMSRARRDKQKTCPHCGETILKGASVCRFCHAELIPKHKGA